MKKYEYFGLLTNRRWIQKSFNLFNYKNDNKVLTVNNDIGYIELSEIKGIYTSPVKKEILDLLILTQKEDVEEGDSVLYITLKEQELLEFLPIFKSQVKISDEKPDKFYYGDRIYYIVRIQQD